MFSSVETKVGPFLLITVTLPISSKQFVTRQNANGLGSGHPILVGEAKVANEEVAESYAT